MTVALGVLLYVLAVMGFALLFSDASGPQCEWCGWKLSHCQEARYFTKQPCCARCSHPRAKL